MYIGQTKRVATVIGTRPEAIKMAPVIRALDAAPGLESTVILTGQHRELVEPILPLFSVRPDHDLGLMRPDQTLTGLAGLAMEKLAPVLVQERPDFVLVQGDTTTAVIGAVCAAYLGIPVGHVEAGLRSYDMANPFPEELNRRLISTIAALHFAPTETSRQNLLRECVQDDSIVVTGNTVIDSLLFIADRVTDLPVSLPSPPAAGGRTVLVTMHRRESFGPKIVGLLQAIAQLVDEFPDIEVLYPVHPNPNVQMAVRSVLADRERIHLLAPLDYPSFVAAMKRSSLILSDSGGVQEEAPSLGVPVLVLRDETERPEVVEAGAARLVGRNPAAVLGHARELLSDPVAHDRMARARNPFGDGRASDRILKAVEEFLQVYSEPDRASYQTPSRVAMRTRYWRRTNSSKAGLPVT
jgi:UDP-N-acetylglucosamine 2-epimerase (non-hydrolysing)